MESFSVNSNRAAAPEEYPAEDADTQEPLPVRRDISAQRPAAMRGDFMHNHRAPGHDDEKDDKHSVERVTHRVNPVSGVADNKFPPADPLHVNAGDAGHQGGYHEHPPCPAVKGHGAGPYLPDQLQRSAEGQDGSQQSVHAKGQVSNRIARDPTSPDDEDLVPVLKISGQGGAV